MAGEYVSVGRLVEQVHFAFTNTATVGAALRRQIVYQLDHVLRELTAETTHRSFLVEATITLVAGTSDYNLPQDFRRLLEPTMRLLESPYSAVRWYDMADRVANEWDAGGVTEGSPVRFSVPGPNSSGRLFVRFWPLPSAANVVGYQYWAHARSLIPSGNPDDVSDDQTLDARFPRDVIEGLVSGTQLRFPQYMGQDQVGIAAGFYARAMKRMKASTPVEGQRVVQRAVALSDYAGGGGGPFYSDPGVLLPPV